jgi:hypothetical protein
MVLYTGDVDIKWCEYMIDQEAILHSRQAPGGAQLNRPSVLRLGNAYYQSVEFIGDIDLAAQTAV